MSVLCSVGLHSWEFEAERLTAEREVIYARCTRETCRHYHTRILVNCEKLPARPQPEKATRKATGATSA